LKYDISLKSQDFDRIVQETRQVIQNSEEFSASEKESIITNGFGHIGDGNLHLHITIPGYDNLTL
jgi:hypothetical protein